MKYRAKNNAALLDPDDLERRRLASILVGFYLDQGYSKQEAFEKAYSTI